MVKCLYLRHPRMRWPVPSLRSFWCTYFNLRMGYVRTVCVMNNVLGLMMVITRRFVTA